MTYQNIMIDRIKEILISKQCNSCPLIYECWDKNNGNYCKELKDWLNEQYI